MKLPTTGLLTAFATAAMVTILPSDGQAVPEESPARHLAQILLQERGQLDTWDNVLPDDGSYYDIHRFQGEAGQTVTVTLESSDFDTYLIILDSQGNALAQNDDVSQGNFNSAVTITLPRTGTYQAIANAYDSSGLGRYVLTVSASGGGTSRRPTNTSRTPSTPTPIVQQPSNGLTEEVSAQVGWLALGRRELNHLVIPVYQYVGECPGRGIGDVRAAFISSTLDPDEDLEVEIRNITIGIDSDPYPHINRDYDNGRASESAIVTFGTEHIRRTLGIGSRQLAVMRGINEFEYEITHDDDVVLERGTFTTLVEGQTITRERNQEQVEETYCRTGAPMWNCDEDDIRVREVWRCP